MFLPIFIHPLITQAAAKKLFFCQDFPVMNAYQSFNDFKYNTWILPLFLINSGLNF